MADGLFSLKLTTPAMVAAGITLLLWWLFSFVTPDQPLGVMETAVVFLVVYGISFGVSRWLEKRKAAKSEEQA